MNAFLGRPPVLWFLFLVNAAVAALAPFVLDGPQALAASVGMGAVSLGAACALVLRARTARAAARGVDRRPRV